MEKQKLLKTTLSLATVATMGQTGLLSDLVKPVNAVKDVTQTDYSKYEDLIKESEQRLEEAKENLDKVQAEYDEVNQAETDAKNTYEENESKVNTTKADIDAAFESIMTPKQEKLDQDKAVLENAQKTLETFTQTLAQKQTDLSNAQVALEDARKALEEAQANYDENYDADKLAELYEEELAAEQAYDEAVKAVEEVQAKIDELKAVQSQAQTAYDTAKEELDNANADVTTKENELKVLEESLIEKQKALEEASDEQLVIDANKEIELAQAAVDSAKQDVEDAKAVVAEKEAAVTEAQKALEDASKLTVTNEDGTQSTVTMDDLTSELANAEAEQERNRTELADVEAQLQTAQENKAKAEQEIEAIKADVSAKEKEVQEAQKVYDEMVSANEAYAKELETLRSNVETAQQNLTALQNLYNYGSYGFFMQTMADNGDGDSQRAAALFRDETLKAYSTLDGSEISLHTLIGGPNDATNLENMKYALQYLKVYNEILKYEGLPEAKVSHYAMAVSQLSINAQSQLVFAHAYLTKDGNMQSLYESENIAFDSMQVKIPEDQIFEADGSFDVESFKKLDGNGNEILNPYYGWYVEEGRYAQDPNTTEETGHYENIMSTTDTDYYTRFTGFAYNTYSYFPLAAEKFAQDWVIEYKTNGETQTKGYTVDEYIALFNNYYNTLTSSIDQAEAELQKAQNAYNAKLNEDGMQALDEAYNQLAELSAELEALKESQADKQAEIDEYTEDIATLNLIKTGKETDIESVNDSIDILNGRIDSLQAQIDNAQADFDKAEVDLTEAKNDQTTLENVVLDRENTLAEKRTALQAIYDNIEKAEKDLADTTKARDDKIVDIERAKLAQVFYQNNFESAETDLNTATTDVENAESELSNVNAVADDKEAILKDVQGKIADIVNLETDLNDAKTGLADAQERVETLNKEIADIETEMTALEDTIEDTLVQIALDEDILEPVKSAMSNWTAIIQDSSVEYNYYTDETEAVRPMIEEYISLKAKSVELKAEWDKASAEEEAKLAELLAADKAYNDAKSALEEAQKALEDYQNSLINKDATDGQYNVDGANVSVSKDNGNKSVDTGDGFDMGMFAALGAMALGGIALSRKKKED